MEIKVPFLGDGIDTANVISVLVSPGDSVDLEQVLVELETDKATAPVPSTAKGVVEKVLLKEGDSVQQGTLVVTLSGASGEKINQAENQASAPVLAASPQAVTPEVVGNATVSAPNETYQFQSSSGSAPAAMPGIHKIATQIGLDLSRVFGSGKGSRITWDDLRAHISMLQAKAFAKPAAVQSESNQPKTIAPLDIDALGPNRREALSSLRQKISANMQKCWEEIPHVTQFQEIDITALMALRKQYNPQYVAENARLTVTVFIVKALASTLKSYPEFNACYDAATQDLIYREYMNIGVAVDTENGLIVPVIKNIETKSLFEISKELESIAAKARDRKLALADIQGAGFTVSNLGSLGVGAFTPIVNAPEVAILGVGMGELKPKYIDKKWEPRMVMPVSLSYDHRVINGADGARFIKDVQSQLENFDESLLKEGI